MKAIPMSEETERLIEKYGVPDGTVAGSIRLPKWVLDRVIMESKTGSEKRQGDTNEH